MNKDFQKKDQNSRHLGMTYKKKLSRKNLSDPKKDIVIKK